MTVKVKMELEQREQLAEEVNKIKVGESSLIDIGLDVVYIDCCLSDESDLLTTTLVKKDKRGNLRLSTISLMTRELYESIEHKELWEKLIDDGSLIILP